MYNHKRFDLQESVPLLVGPCKSRVFRRGRIGIFKDGEVIGV